MDYIKIYSYGSGKLKKGDPGEIQGPGSEIPLPNIQFIGS